MFESLSSETLHSQLFNKRSICMVTVFQERCNEQRSWWHIDKNSVWRQFLEIHKLYILTTAKVVWRFDLYLLNSLSRLLSNSLMEIFNSIINSIKCIKFSFSNFNAMLYWCSKALVPRPFIPNYSVEGVQAWSPYRYFKKDATNNEVGDIIDTNFVLRQFIVIDLGYSIISIWVKIQDLSNLCPWLISLPSLIRFWWNKKYLAEFNSLHLVNANNKQLVKINLQWVTKAANIMMVICP